ncbi:thioester domain-containing protein [Nocardioides daejeonensis]|uniref:thioester domain-containing protein n=1 Tax=Nocardioides daejeonensis TaxID=1046556 RepID=UPI000D7457BA|nr:thioester domain-containing protein [Nocardioides daejeonensis]
MSEIKRRRRVRGRWIAAAALALTAITAPAWTTGAAADPDAGATVYLGGKLQGYPGTGLHGVYNQQPADPGNPGAPDFWAYCIEHDVDAAPHRDATVGDFADYLGNNHFSDPVVQGKVLWILAHSYPALSLSEFGTAAGVPGITQNDAIEATQYAIWRFTDLDFDASWAWETDASKVSAVTCRTRGYRREHDRGSSRPCHGPDHHRHPGSPGPPALGEVALAGGDRPRHGLDPRRTRGDHRRLHVGTAQAW